MNGGAILFLEPVGGIAGDMFLAAALDLGIDRAELERSLATLGVPFRLEVARAEASGLAGLHVEVVPQGPQPHDRSLADVLAIVRESGLSARAKATATALFEAVGRAEARVHGVPYGEVRFHEVGGVDSIADVCGAAVALELMGWPRVVSLPPELGRGFARTAHGRMPVPAPAALELLRGKAIRPSGPPGEAVTPTGAALLAVLCEVGEAPLFVPRKTGYGVGTVRWPDRPNVLRLTLGDAWEPARPPPPSGAAGHLEDGLRVEGAASTGGLVQLEANLDDCPGQLVARAIEVALEAGALDAWAAPVTMKKGRPGVVLSALAPAALAGGVARAFLVETTTLGVRSWPVDRVELERELVPVETPYGAVRVKVGRLAGAELGAQPEYDDCLLRARERGVSVREVAAAALAAHRARAAR